MRIQFCGADRTVTGTSHLIEVNGLKIFLDMGMYQGPREQARRLNEWIPDDARSANAVILTHGHLDHCGKLPVLVQAGYNGPIHCTSATAAVARIVLEDAGEIQEENASYLNRRTRDGGTGEDAKPVRPLYRRGDIPAVLRLMKPTEYGQRVDLGRDVGFTLYDAGHILGSAYVVLDWRENGRDRKLLFTGDIGRYNTPIIRDPHTLPGPVDYTITESTYGDRPHAAIAEVEPQLLQAVRDCIERRSRLLVPAFAVGRTQTMLWYMQKFIKEGSIRPIPIYVDSPMGVEVSQVHRQFPQYFDDQTRQLIGQHDLFGLSRVTFAISSADSRRVNADNGPCVIIASSPTCEFGRILHHLKQSVERPQDIVIFVGWTPPHTLGRRLQSGEKRVRILDRWYDVSCEIRTIHGLSAHADGDEILRFLQPTLSPRTTMYVVHGEPESAETMANRLLGAGAARALIPAMETVEICP